MSAVVSDAGPLHYLILIGCAGILSELFDRVHIPAAVRQELDQSNSPQIVKDWIVAPKNWLQIERVIQSISLPGLHRGEAEALQPALRIKADAVLMDDLDGRREAHQRGLVVIGTVGLLERAAEKGLIELSLALARLRETNIFVGDELLAAALARDRRRRNL